MKLALDAHDGVEVLFGLHEVAQVRGHNPLDLRVVVRVGAQDGLSAAEDVVGEVFLLGVADELGW